MDAEVKVKPNLTVVKPDEIHHVLEKGELGCVLEWTVTDKNGNVREHVVKKSESFVRQFLEILYVQMTYQPAARMSVRDTGNTLRDVKSLASTGSGNMGVNFDVLAGATVTTFGILVGTGSTAPTINDFAMEVLIAHGAGAGAMQYGAITFGAPGSDATTSQLTITRNFVANVGGITVNEIGVVCRASYGPSASISFFLIIRDVIGGGIVVPAGQTLTLNYRPQATV